MSDDPWVSPVHTTSADENEAYASHPLYAEVAALTAERDRLREELDLAIAHDRQPYPTADAYEAACRALEKHRERADKAEAERDRLREERDLGFSMRNETMDALWKMREERDDAEARALICCEKFRPERDTLAAKLAQAETVIEKAAAYVKEHRWMLNGLAQWRDEGTKIGPGNDVRLDLAAAVDAYQATPATTERDHETPLDIYWAVERDSGRPLPSDAIVPRTTERQGAGDE
jgi:hypothetical protein